MQYNAEVQPLIRAPEPSADTEEVLLELGMTWADLTELKSRDVIA